jgi:AcrR family transcriptional regulator
MDARSDNIIQVAIAMAERDGYDAVRMRDLAAQAGASLATVYRRFHRKEDILAAALEQHMTLLSASLQASPIPGASPAERLGNFFTLATRRMAERPRLAAAMLRTVASGVPELAERVTRYHGRMSECILGVTRGAFTEEAPTQSERDVVQLLQGVWLAALVGWTGGLYGHEQVIEQTNTAIRLLLAGQEPT